MSLFKLSLPLSQRRRVVGVLPRDRIVVLAYYEKTVSGENQVVRNLILVRTSVLHPFMPAFPPCSGHRQIRRAHYDNDAEPERRCQGNMRAAFSLRHQTILEFKFILGSNEKMGMTVAKDQFSGVVRKPLRTTTNAHVRTHRFGDMALHSPTNSDSLAMAASKRPCCSWLVLPVAQTFGEDHIAISRVVTRIDLVWRASALSRRNPVHAWHPDFGHRWSFQPKFHQPDVRCCCVVTVAMDWQRFCCPVDSGGRVGHPEIS